MYLDSQLKGGDLIRVEKDRGFRALIRNMETMEDHKFQVPPEQEKILRGYQKEGFCWIKTLKHNRFGGILADDMGLGKNASGDHISLVGIPGICAWGKPACACGNSCISGV